MKKKILSQLMILSFAFAGLFLMGNNVLGNSGGTGDLDDDLFPGIICAQNPRVGATCWPCPQSIGPCYWTGYMQDICCQWA
jgi:hypothetical protein